MTELRLEVRALYAVDDPPSRDRPQGSGFDQNPHRRDLPVASVASRHAGYRIERPHSSEYSDQRLSYRVTRAEVRRWSAPGLPDVGELRVDVEADALDGLIDALKDLYDPMVDVEIDGALLSAHFRDDRRQGPLTARALVVSLVDGGVVDDDVLGQLFCKDIDIEFDLTRMCVESPDDLNAARRNAISIWGEQTVVAAMDPLLRDRGWVDTMVALSAAVTAARHATGASVERVRKIRTAPDLSPLRRLESIVDVQAAHEAAVRTRLDALLLSVGRPLASYLESLIRQTKLDVAVASLEATLRDALRNIEVEARLEERRRAEEAAHAARDVRTVVSMFAVVSILFSILGLAVGITSIPEPSESRYGHLPDVLALAMLAFLGAASVSLVLVRSTRRRSTDDARRVRRWRGLLGVGFAVAAALLVAAVAVPGSWLSTVLVGASAVLVVVSATQMARAFRLSHDAG